jgi:hypothetical protein
MPGAGFLATVFLPLLQEINSTAKTASNAKK